jgi:hypothetical protein
VTLGSVDLVTFAGAGHDWIVREAGFRDGVRAWLASAY